METKRYDVEMAMLMTQQNRYGSRRRHHHHRDDEEEKGEGEDEKELSMLSKYVLKYPHGTSLILVTIMLYTWFVLVPFQPYGPVISCLLLTSFLFISAHKERIHQLLHTKRGRRIVAVFLIFLLLTYVLIHALGGYAASSIGSSRLDMSEQYLRGSRVNNKI